MRGRPAAEAWLRMALDVSRLALGRLEALPALSARLESAGGAGATGGVEPAVAAAGAMAEACTRRPAHVLAGECRPATITVPVRLLQLRRGRDRQLQGAGGARPIHVGRQD